MPSRYRINAPQVVYELLDGEYVLINFESGHYYSLVGSGAFVWALLDRGASLTEIAEALVRRYGGVRAEMEQHARTFVDACLAEALIAVRQVPPAGSGPSADTEVPATLASTEDESAAEPFVPPALATYSDMKELILLDPIHEVDASGWPEKAPKPDAVPDTKPS